MDDVSNGVDAVGGRLEVVVHFDAAALVQLHSNIFQSQTSVVRPPPYASHNLFRLNFSSKTRIWGGGYTITIHFDTAMLLSCEGHTHKRCTLTLLAEKAFDAAMLLSCEGHTHKGEC